MTINNSLILQPKKILKFLHIKKATLDPKEKINLILIIGFTTFFKFFKKRNQNLDLYNTHRHQSTHNVFSFSNFVMYPKWQIIHKKI
jgi:hypothetical protein